MTIVTCEKLTKTYGDKQALRDMSFSIENTGCIGFLGRNGAGKTTTIRILTGLAYPTSGKVEVVGYDVQKYRMSIHRDIGYCPQAPTFYPHMTGEEWMHWVGAIFKMNKASIRKRSEELLQLCDIWDARKRRIGGYSGGMKQRLGIAQALINQPKLLVLDEPVSALDPMGRYDVLKLIEKIKEETTIFMSTHILDDVERIADHIVIIDEGKVVLSSTMEDLKKKYIEPVISFSVETDSLDIFDILKNDTWVSHIHRDGNNYRVRVADIEQAKYTLLKRLVDSHAVLMTYHVGSSSLEDVFMKVVKK